MFSYSKIISNVFQLQKHLQSILIKPFPINSYKKPFQMYSYTKRIYYNCKPCPMHSCSKTFLVTFL